MRCNSRARADLSPAFGRYASFRWSTRCRNPNHSVQCCYGSQDIAGVGSGFQSQLLQITPGAHLQGNGKFSVGADSNSWFATRNGDGTNIFITTAAGTFTSQHNRNILVGPGSANFNASLQKKFQIFEDQALVFRLGAFDFSQPSHWSVSDSTYTDATFGKVTSKSWQRSMQASLRYSF
jgi:hypothetical protein